MKRNIAKKVAKRKKNIAKRLEKRNWSEQKKPMMAGRNICYDVDGRHQGTAHGGIGNGHPIQMILHQADLPGIRDNVRRIDPQFSRHTGDNLFPPVADDVCYD